MSKQDKAAALYSEPLLQPAWPSGQLPSAASVSGAADQARARIAAPAIAMLAALAALVGICFFGFLHEDAYILYIYGRHLVDTGQIAFDSLHGPAEGATDFLWMMMISGGYALGIDPGVAAAALNTLGAGLLAAAFANVSAWRRSPGANLLIAALVVCSPMMGAALGGFSTLFYTGVYATILSLLCQGRHVAAIWGTLVLCLTRPDGAVLSLGTMGLLLWQQRRDARVLAHLAAITALGGAYFVWRWRYFGEVLPLPLMVKSKGDGGGEGLMDNLRALWPMAPALLLALRHTGAHRPGALLKVLLPAALLFAALSFAHQSQNISLRFQGPIYVSILMALLMARLKEWKLYALGLVPFMLLGAKNVALEARYLAKPDYINVLPSELKAALGTDAPHRVALTEAGRFPYYFPAQYMDLVGLNTRVVAKNGLSLDHMAAFKPDLIFLHHAGTYDVSGLAPGRFVKLDRATFLAQVYRHNDSANPVLIAPSLVGPFAAAHERFDTAYVVHYGKGYHHVYLLDGSRLPAKAFEAALTRSFDDRGSSHCSKSANWPCTWAH